ncbi:MAG: hypothetical protein ACRC5C_08615 [Bacilli bacterium]
MKQLLAELEIVLQSEYDYHTQMKNMIALFYHYSAVHQAVKSIPQVRAKKDDHLSALLEQLKPLHEALFTMIVTFIDKGIQNNIVRNSIDRRTVAQFIFYTIDMPKHPDLSDEQWLLQLQDFILFGIEQNN